MVLSDFSDRIGSGQKPPRATYITALYLIFIISIGERPNTSSTGLTFLSEEWVRAVVATIEHAKSSDEKVRLLASEFSLSIAYVVEELPETLAKKYGSDKVVIYVELERGVVTRFLIGVETLKESNPDFTVESTYNVVKKIFLGELNPATAFIRRYIRVKPLMKLYLDPAFAAKSFTTLNTLLQIAKNVPTVFPEFSMEGSF